MFVIATLADTIRIPPCMFNRVTRTCAHEEIDKKYPNRVLMDVGLVICRYGNVTRIGDGVCVPGDGAAHHEVVFRLVIFRPFVEEVCLGHIVESNEEGLKISLGEFFSDIFVPAHWMLKPSKFDKESSLWSWTPQYGDDEEEGGEGGDGDGDGDGDGAKAEEEEEEEGYDMEIGAEIRFKVKGINFTQITNTAKGVQATTTSTTSSKMPGFKSSSSTDVGKGDDPPDNGPVRKRSTSVDLSDSMIPASMQITASICEDGLGLVSWWSNQEEEEGEEEEEYAEENGGEEGGYEDEAVEGVTAEE